VEQLNDLFGITNSGAAAVASLHMPSVKPAPAPAPTGGDVQYPHYQYVGGSPSGSRAGSLTVPGFTNQFGTNQTLTNWWVVSGGRSRGSLLVVPGGESVAASGVSPAPAANSGSPLAAHTSLHGRQPGAEVDPWSLQGMYQQVMDKAPAVLRKAALAVYDIPWYLLLLLLAALLELRRRVRARRKHIVRHPDAFAQSMPRRGVATHAPHSV
jgi:hypothetical protein